MRDKTRRRVKTGVATVFALYLAGVGILMVRSLNGAGHWDKFTAFAFVAGALAVSGGWVLSHLLYNHLRGGASV